MALLPPHDKVTTWISEIISGIADPIFVKDEQHRWVLLNDAFCRFLGKSRDELLGKSDYDLFPKQEADVFWAHDDRVFAGGIVDENDEHITDPQGVGHWISTRKAAFIGSDGEKYLVGTIRDVTEQHRTNERLELFESALARSPDGVLVMSQSTAHGPPRIIYCNQSFETMSGYRATEILGQSPMVLYGPASEPERLHLIMRLFEQGEAGVLDITNHKKDGSPFHIELSFFPLVDDAGRPTHWVCFQRDTSARREFERQQRRIEEQMQHAQRLESLGVLAGGIAHDFNNLLAGVLANVEIAIDNAPIAGTLRDSLSAILDAAGRMAELTRQMLAYAGKHSTDFQPLDIVGVVRELISLLRASVSKKATLTLACKDPSVVVDGDKAQIVQVLMNLIVNASEAIGDRSGEITVSVGVGELDEAMLTRTPWPVQMARGQRCACLRVEDTGQGMTEEVLRRIFDPFFSTKFAGRGLGLAAVLGIVRSHRGALTVDSQPGRGTAFQVCLPLSLRTVTSPAQKAVAERTLAGKRALLIDDERVVREAAGKILRNQGVEVLEAVDGNEGVELFRRERGALDVIICDMTMPGLDGHEVFGALEKIGRDNVPFVLMSGYERSAATARFPTGALAGFVTKPFASVDLIDAVEEALAHRSW